MRTPVPSDVIEQLRDQFACRVAKFHSSPTSLTLSFTEMENLCSAFPNAILLESFRRAGSFTARNQHISHEIIYRVIRSIANKLLLEAHAVRKHRQYEGMGIAQATSAAAPTIKPVTEEDILATRQLFQEHCTHGDWTLTGEQVAEYMKRAGRTTALHKAIERLHRYKIEHFEQALSDLNAAIDSVLWMQEVQQ